VKEELLKLIGKGVGEEVTVILQERL